ncbi:MAG: 5-formyltetrahydrofolate cyclo-ligase [Spirochaetales bacterium]|nr:5-formyltetrahydrofolate cyclo-ligase [Spirochaetales bacterium]
MHDADLRNAKNALRKSMKTLLKAMDEASRSRLSSQVVENFMKLPEYKTAAIVLAFLSMKEELQTKTLIDKGLADGKLVAVPRMGFSADLGDFLEFIPLPHDYGTWPLDRFGIPEPPRDARVLSLEELGRSCVAVAVPGLAFDLRGGRMGRGKGYYDRFLASARASAARYDGSLVACGICFESQVVETVPMGPWDQRVDFLATEAALKMPSWPGLSNFQI